MRVLSLLLFMALFLFGACATGVPQKQTALHEQRAASIELDKQIGSLADQLITSLDILKTHKIALIEFPNLEGNTTDFGKYLAEELTTRLVRTGRFQIIERQLMNKIMEEQKLSATGLIDEKSASKFGQILGVDALTTGTIADLHTSVKINARVIASETGAVYAAASVTVPMTKEVELLLGMKPGEATRADLRRFDGDWDVSIACAPQEGGMSYAMHMSANVNDGVFHGQLGTEGIGPFLVLEGKINPDGSAFLNANGLTGDPKYSSYNVPKNTPYSYHVDAHFSDYRGTGNRLEFRVCNLIFVKH